MGREENVKGVVPSVVNLSSRTEGATTSGLVHVLESDSQGSSQARNSGLEDSIPLGLYRTLQPAKPCTSIHIQKLIRVEQNMAQIHQRGHRWIQLCGGRYFRTNIVRIRGRIFQRIRFLKAPVTYGTV